jgi:hypothetical protein
LNKKLCKICGINPATIPDRERMGRPVKSICVDCHSLRLSGDMAKILELEKRKRGANEKS